MTIVGDDRALRPASVLDALGPLLPDIGARAPEIEANRRVPGDLLDRLKAAGAFRLLLPTSHGGAGSDLAAALPVYEALARADASTAWIAVIGGVSWLDLVSLPRETFDEIYPPGADTVAAGVFNPTGTVRPADGGYVVDGRWSFASGCEHADWFYGNCVDASGDQPLLRMAVLPRDEITIEDTWSVSGLRGTGSHDVVVRGALVPAARTCAVFADPPCLDSPLTRIPLPSAAPLLMGAVAVGTAQGALDDVISLAAGKTPLLAPTTLATNPRFQHVLGTADVQLRAARCLLQAEAAALSAATQAGGELTLALRSRARAAGVHAVTAAADVVDAAYRAGGGTALYDSSPLQRRLRDSRALTQHFLVKDDTLTSCGAVLAGLDPDVEVF
ncbi:MAG TPA: acyl-CoA dehydrogenase family protein [Acidimicrobiales bacterium]|jgi:alkylation response protein AidB-like acyl-CoA dehydrogenase